MATLFGHSNVGCLSSEEKTMVNQLTKNMVKPDQILLIIKDQNQKNINTIKIIYNEHKKYIIATKGFQEQKYNVMNSLLVQTTRQ